MPKCGAGKNEGQNEEAEEKSVNDKSGASLGWSSAAGISSPLLVFLLIKEMHCCRHRDRKIKGQTI